MPLAGKQLLPREIADIGHMFWNNYELTKMIATSLGESQGFLGAYHDNDNGVDPDPDSRDCGLMQINIAARFIGTQAESDLRTESLDANVYQGVAENNVQRGFELYSASWNRGNKIDIRRWQPWVAYTSGWATFPHAWIWHQENGKSIGPWVQTGRYIYRAIAGQMNRHILITKDWIPETALHYAKMYTTHFGITDATPQLVNGIVQFKYDPAPATAPADGIGPRPVPNDGQ